MKKTVYFVAFFAIAATIFSLCFSVNNSTAADGQKFAIAYSGNIMGYFESCG